MSNIAAIFIDRFSVFRWLNYRVLKLALAC